MNCSANKKELRRRIREWKGRQNVKDIERWSQDITQRLLAHPKVMEASCVMLFWPMPDEVDIRGAVRELHARGKTVVLPRVTSDTEMVLCEYRGDESLKAGRYGILEPQCLLAERTTVDVVVVPGMAFTQDGWRLGRGKGYYDRMLAMMPEAYTIGVCYPFQLLEELPHDDYDIRMKEVLCPALI